MTVFGCAFAATYCLYLYGMLMIWRDLLILW